MAKDLEKVKWEDLVSRLLENLSERNRDVVSRRFGIGVKEPETLESIGDAYSITRERVRQIEKFSLDQLRRTDEWKGLDDARGALVNYMEEKGHLVREERLLSELPTRSASHVVFLLSLGDEFNYIDNHELFHPVWVLDLSALKLAERLLRDVSAELEREAKLLEEEELVDRLLTKAKGFKEAGLRPDEDGIRSYIDAARHLEQDARGRWGLSHWVEIRPRGMRDKGYLVLRESGHPLHFREIANLINKTSFSRLASVREAHPQTVHNELIKDERFVLVGRGLYALREWGYAPGTVKDVLRTVLGDAKTALDRDEIIDRVLKQRFVKINTILLNLQDKNHFRRLEDDRYILT